VNSSLTTLTKSVKSVRIANIGILTTDFRKVKRLSVHDAGQTEMSDPPNITVGRLVPKCNFGTPPVKKV